MVDDVFRREYRELNTEQRFLMGAAKDAAEELHRVLLLLPMTREQSLAITKLEECVMWATKAATDPLVTGESFLDEKK